MGKVLEIEGRCGELGLEELGGELGGTGGAVGAHEGLQELLVVDG